MNAADTNGHPETRKTVCSRCKSSYWDKPRNGQAGSLIRTNGKVVPTSWELDIVYFVTIILRGSNPRQYASSH